MLVGVSLTPPAAHGALTITLSVHGARIFLTGKATVIWAVPFLATSPRACMVSEELGGEERTCMPSCPIVYSPVRQKTILALVGQ
jgi:hypothetical protein